MLLDTALPLTIAGAAVIMDLRTAKVENGWILFSLLTGSAYRLLRDGPGGIVLFLAGAMIPLITLTGLFYFRMLGPGDIKVFCALGGVLGVRRIGYCMLYSLFLGAFIALLLLLFNGDIRQRIHYFLDYFLDCLLTGTVRPYYRKGMTQENFHFTVPIFLSVVLYAGGLY